MERRQFTREFKIEAVKLVRERGIAVEQAARDLSVHENVFRKRVKDFTADPQQAVPGHGQMRPEQLEIERLRREVHNLKAEHGVPAWEAAEYLGMSTEMIELYRSGAPVIEHAKCPFYSLLQQNSLPG